MRRSKDFTDTVDSYTIKTLMDDFEAELAEGQHQRLLNKFIDLRREFENYFNNAYELAEALNDVYDIVEG